MSLGQGRTTRAVRPWESAGASFGTGFSWGATLLRW
jgi:hypothetical protein